MIKPRLLDLFCGAGGCSMGYHRAGFDVVGVDRAPQPRYPFEFIQADALMFLRNVIDSTGIMQGHGWGAREGDGASVSFGYTLEDFDAIAASPPCQVYSRCRRIGNARPGHLDLVPQTRTLLLATGKPYVVENVEGAPLHYPLLLCGSMFGLPLIRHRIFESNVMLMCAAPCLCDRGERYGVYAGKVTRIGSRATPYKDSNGRTHHRPQLASRAKGREAMGIDWMDMKELSQAIPPAYTEFIGKQLIRVLEGGTP